MDDMWTRVGTQLLARVSGPMKFRLVLQPCMAAFFAIRAGLADARAGKPPYFWGLLTDHGQRNAYDEGRVEECRQSIHSCPGARCRLSDHRVALCICGRNGHRRICPGDRALLDCARACYASGSYQSGATSRRCPGLKTLTFLVSAAWSHARLMDQKNRRNWE